MESIVKTVGLDLAKNSFHVFCADAEGNRVQSKKLRRNQVLPYFEELGAPCMVAMETCTGANWWCRRLRDLGHDARLIPAAFVKPYVCQCQVKMSHFWQLQGYLKWIQAVRNPALSECLVLNPPPREIFHT